MKIAIIGRSEVLYDTALRLRDAGHQIVCILTAKHAPEYARTVTDFRDLASSWCVPFAQGARIEDHAGFLHESAAEVGVSVNYPSVIPQSVINLFRLGVLNAHGGDLPRYRGNACQAWAIINGEDRIGLCIHRMVGGELDSGDIVARDYLKINYMTKVTEALDWIRSRSPGLFMDALENLNRDEAFALESESNDLRPAMRCYPRRPEDARIDWSKSALEILRLINASNKPYAGAFCYFQGEKLIIWDAELVEDKEDFCAVAGQVTNVQEGSVEVACGEGKLRVLLMQNQGALIAPSSLIFSIRKRLE